MLFPYYRFQDSTTKYTTQAGKNYQKLPGMVGYTWSSNLNEKYEGGAMTKECDNTNKLSLKAVGKHKLPISNMQNTNPCTETKTDESMTTVDASQVIPVVDIV